MDNLVAYNEEKLVEENLVKCVVYTKGNLSAASRLLGIDRRTIQRRIERNEKLREAIYNHKNDRVLQ